MRSLHRSTHRGLLAVLTLALTLGGPCLLGLGLLASPSTAAAQARDYSATGRIQFVSRAQLETITGRSRRLTGTVHFDPSNASSLVGSTFSVPVSSIRTNNDLRDEHLRGPDWLNAGAHPNATFEVTRVSGASSVAPNEAVRLQVTGNFTINGQTHEITATARVRHVPESNTFRIRASFRVNLPQFGVSVNPLVRLKVSDTIRVNVSWDGRAR
jgi:polyisoprenoid-binding protein YceI